MARSEKNIKQLFFGFLIGVALLYAPLVFASNTNGTLSGYAWSPQIGWINFGNSHGDVHLTDSAMTGYAWNENFGWINLAPTHSGVQNNSEGTLSGKAWSQGTGWVDFSGVTVNSSGVFSGTATGDNSISILFSCAHCNVTTDWRPASSRSGGGSGGGGGSVSQGTPTTSAPAGPLTIIINQGEAYTNTRQVTLHLDGGPNPGKVAISNSPDVSQSSQQDFHQTLPWELSPGDGLKTVYVVFYTNFNIPSQTFSASITLDTTAPQVAITSIEKTYLPGSQIVLAGTAEPNSHLTIFIDNQYGEFDANAYGQWIINLGILPAGNHQVTLIAKDQAGNVSLPVTAEFSVGAPTEQPSQVTPPPFTLAPPLAPILKELAQGIQKLLPGFLQPLAKNFSPVVLAPPLNPILRELAQGVQSAIPNFFQPLARSFPQFALGPPMNPLFRDFAQGVQSAIPKFFQPLARSLPQVALGPPLNPIFREFAQGLQSFLPGIFQPLAKAVPTPLVLVPKNAPLAFKGRYSYVSLSALSQFVLAPLPADIRLLAQNLPQVQKTFNQVGVKKITDVQKLLGTNLKLPTLTQVALPATSLAAEKFAAMKGVPLAKLTTADKEKIPSSIIFAKAAGGLVDFNVALSINSQGKTEQKIATVVGNSLQLVVKADKPVKKVIGYVVFKSKKYTPVGFQVPLNSLAASLLFSNPALTAAVQPTITVPVEGANTAKTQPAENSSGIEQRLVLFAFEYTDSGNGVYTATIQAPAVDGEYEIITVMDYLDSLTPSKEIKLTTVVDPEGYVYEKNGSLETRISGAVVSLYWLNPQTKNYELWPAKDFQQEDPQVTDVRGTYSFLVPEGLYYLKVDAPGYQSYDGKPFELKEGSGVHINIELKSRYWWLNIVDWKTLLLIAVIILLVYNFYKDRLREKQERNLHHSVRA